MKYLQNTMASLHDRFSEQITQSFGKKLKIRVLSFHYENQQTCNSVLPFFSQSVLRVSLLSSAERNIIVHSVETSNSLILQRPNFKYNLLTRDVIQETCQYDKCKAIPVHTWKRPSGSRRLRFQDFKTIGRLYP